MIEEPKCTDQWDRIKNSERNPYIYGQPLKGGENGLQEIVLGQVDIPMQKNELEPVPHTI